MLDAAAFQAHNQQHAVAVFAGGDRVERDLQIGKADGDVGDDFGRILGVDMQHGLEIAVILAVGLLRPGGDDPAVLVLGLAQAGDGVGAVVLMDGHAEALGDEADDRVARQRVAALGELNVAALQSVRAEDDARALAHTVRALEGRDALVAVIRFFCFCHWGFSISPKFTILIFKHKI